jgi:hypothetical protein
MSQPADWYTDPSGRYKFRYWDGSQWTNQVSSGGPSALDPNPLDAAMVGTPPVPGSQAAQAEPKPEPAAPPPAVQISQKSGGMGMGVVIGALVALIAVIVLILVLAPAPDDDTTDTTNPPTTEEPAGDTTGAPEE